MYSREYCLLGCDLCSLVDTFKSFGGTCCIHLQGRRISLLRRRILWNVSEYYYTTQHHIPEDSNLNFHCHENLDPMTRKLNLSKVHVSVCVQNALSSLLFCEALQTSEARWWLSHSISGKPRSKSLLIGWLSWLRQMPGWDSASN
jgi:hypothetical protein